MLFPPICTNINYFNEISIVQKLISRAFSIFHVTVIDSFFFVFYACALFVFDMVKLLYLIDIRPKTAG